jgi:broad-specificity NMP kinase
MKVMALLGLTVHPDSTARYESGVKHLGIKEGRYINSIHVLLQNFEGPFYFFGTQKAIDKHKEVFGEVWEGKKIYYEKFDENNINEIFEVLIRFLMEARSEKILFDITHSFRDAVIMAVLSTITTQNVYHPDIDMIYAKEVVFRQHYRYELVSEELLQTSNVALVLTTFLDTLRTPKRFTKYGLSSILSDFSTHLVSNQFKEIFESEIPKLRAYIEKNRENLYFIGPLLEELKGFLDGLEKVKNKKTYEQFLYFAELFLKKGYFLQASTYLYEGLIYYVGEALMEQGLIRVDLNIHNDRQKIVVEILKNSQAFKNKSDERVAFPHMFFRQVNDEVFAPFERLRQEISVIRHNLAHINVDMEYEDIEKKLNDYIDSLKALIEERRLYELDRESMSEEGLEIEQERESLQEEIKSYMKPQSSSQSPPKVETILRHYKNGTIGRLSHMDTEGLKRFVQRNEERFKRVLGEE